MQKVIHRLKGKISEPALNSPDISIELRPNEVDSSGEPRISTTTFDFAFKESEVIHEHIKNNGMHQGIPHTISVADKNGELMILDGYLVTSGAEVVYSKEKITGLKSELRGKNESLSKRAKSLIFSSLVKAGRINPVTDYKSVPYIINSIPSYRDAAITTITGFMIINQTRIMAKEIAKALADIAGVLSAIAGIIKVVILIAWIVIVIAQIVILLNDIFTHIIQPVKYHNAMLWKRLLSVGCQELGYEFQSTIFDLEAFEDTVIMPEKFEAFENVNDSFSLGFTTPNTKDSPGYYNGSFYDLLRDTKKTFRASIVITDDNKLIIEPISNPTQDPVYKLPDIRTREYSTNANEVISNYQLSFRQDPSDANTKKDYTGTTVNAVTSLLREDNPDMVTINTPEDGAFLVEIPFARGARKIKLTNIEKQFSSLFKAVAPAINTVVIVANILIDIRNTIIEKIQKVVDTLGTFGINIPFNPKVVEPLPFFDPNVISNRIGLWMLEKDSFDVPKVLSLDLASSPRQTKLKVLNSQIWNAIAIYQAFHEGQSHAITDKFPNGNQERIYKSGGFPLCKESAEEIIRNKRIFTHDGLVARVMSLKWNVRTGIAESIEYRISHADDKNLKTELLIPNGL